LDGIRAVTCLNNIHLPAFCVDLNQSINTRIRRSAESGTVDFAMLLSKIRPTIKATAGATS